MYTDYGLRTLTRLAAEPDRFFTTDEIAAEFSISRNHLVKVIRDLARREILKPHQGATIARGFRLARDPYTISIGEIVRILESGSGPIECRRTDGNACAPTKRCRLAGKLDAAREAFLRTLDKTMLVECAVPPARDHHRPLHSESAVTTPSPI
jgi:Rrf2 family nitric oxide-sensitive transcriptional repressor